MAQRFEGVEPLSVQQIRELQERAARAVPAAVQKHLDGCWLRHTDSTATWWAGATLLHGGRQARDLSATIAAAEDFYAGHQAPARFQVCPACPVGLDEALARRHYERSGTVSLQVATTRHLAGQCVASTLRVDVTESLDAEWLRLLLAAQEPDADPAPEWRLLQRVDRPSAFATAYLSGRAVAVGRAVADTGWAGVFGMATLPGDRGRGAASAVLAGLADWAASRGCAQMYLQVTHDSGSALRLYRRAGFREACTYHYRAAADAPSLPEGD
jgi:ribosomal protein S18 acetylase RimI-like enzyme